MLDIFNINYNSGHALSVIYIIIYVLSTGLYILFITANQQKSCNSNYNFNITCILLSIVVGLPPSPTFFIKLGAIKIVYDFSDLYLLCLYVLVYLLNWVIAARLVLLSFYKTKKIETSYKKWLGYFDNNQQLLFIKTFLLLLVFIFILDFSWLLVLIDFNR